MLAGGLTPENVREAIVAARPFGVDVASGVESAPGKKDPGKVREFITRAKEGLSIAGT
jgi:phosphoribosylanthranilate isomerase